MTPPQEPLTLQGALALLSEAVRALEDARAVFRNIRKNLADGRIDFAVGNATYGLDNANAAVRNIVRKAGLPE